MIPAAKEERRTRRKVHVARSARRIYSALSRDNPPHAALSLARAVLDEGLDRRGLNTTCAAANARTMVFAVGVLLPREGPEAVERGERWVWRAFGAWWDAREGFREGLVLFSFLAFPSRVDYAGPVRELEGWSHKC